MSCSLTYVGAYIGSLIGVSWGTLRVQIIAHIRFRAKGLGLRPRMSNLSFLKPRGSCAGLLKPCFTGGLLLRTT